MVLAKSLSSHFRTLSLLLLASEPALGQQLPSPDPTSKILAAGASRDLLTVRLVARRDWAPQTMEMVKGLVLFQGHVNGRPATILLDNGTGRTVVDTAFARQAGLSIRKAEGAALTGTTRITTYRTGSTVLEVPHAFTMAGELASFDLRPMSQALGRQVDAILGLDATNLMVVMVQPDKRQLSLVSSGSIKLAGPDVVRLPILAGNHVAATINGHSVRLLIDFGYSGAVRLSDAAWMQVMGGSKASTAGQNGVAADGKVIKSRVASGALSVGRVFSATVPIASGYVPVGARSDGLLGTGFFLQGTSVIDGPAQQLMLIVRR